MENAVNIMAMVQSNNIVKKKFDVPSKALGNGIAGFRNELYQAKKDISKDNRIGTKDAEVQTQSTTEKKIEKLAKVMSKNNVKTDVKTEVSKDAKTEVKEKTSVEASDHADSVKATQESTTGETKELAQNDEALKTEEPTQSVLEMLQQLLQMLDAQKAEGSSTPQLTELKTKLEEAIQSLEQSLKVLMTNQAGESNNLLGNLKNDLSEIVKQLEIVPQNELNSIQTEQLMNQLSDKLNLAKAQIQQQLQIHQETVKQKDNSDATPQPLVSVIRVENKETAINNEAKVVEDTDENQQIQKLDSEKASDSKDNKSNDESTYKSNENLDAKQTVSLDKVNLEDSNKITAPQFAKENFQLNIKQANTILQKEGLVKFNAADVINQVIKKADILVQGSHQEMVMKLEPESLGKLNLKIIVENGLVTAKFVAESQQVKEVIESSFNQLKDALQQKGITVQGFSVSVGQQGAEFNSGKGFDQWKQTMKLSSKISGTYMGLDEEDTMSINPYNYHEGKVDYRA